MIESAVLKQMMAKHFWHINEFGCITLNSHFTGSRVINGVTSTSKVYISLSTFETALEYNMMHYFPDYIERLENVALRVD